MMATGLSPTGAYVTADPPQEVIVLSTPAVGLQVVSDSFAGGEVLADQAGAAGVLTFTFSAARQLVWVRSDGGVARANPFGGVPTSTSGIFCDDGVPTPITVTTSLVKVFAPTGTTVKVHGYSY